MSKPFENNADPAVRADVIFAQALQMGPEERKAFLCETCGRDAALRAVVEKMLETDEEAAGFLNSPPSAFETELARFRPETSGKKIGPYKLLEKIGEGGFGTVWVAEQEEPIRRRAALKIIKAGMDTREVVARFEQERQALAMMDHPHIAKVFDAGATPLGRPYFAMELVRGIKITDYCDQEQITTEDRLKLFVQVCHAVQHAHVKGIIHRDLKPSNILVTLHDGVAVPKVIDFGVAKAIQQRLTDLTVYTQFEHMIGTPLYMSPEQAEMSGLDIDTRSDIYSLGVLLYELLAGRTPFDAGDLMKRGLDEIRRAVREQEPQKPSTFISSMALNIRTSVARFRRTDPSKLIGKVRGDLDWIVMKALEKDRARRYETAAGFAHDIQRHLSAEPVQARPPTRAYQFRRFVTRNKVAFASFGAVMLALLTGLSFAIWMYFKERQTRERAVSAEQAEQKERANAELHARCSQQIAEFLKEILVSVAPEAARGRDTELLRDVMEKTFVRLESDLKEQPEVRAELAVVIGKVYGALGEYEKAVRVFESALVVTTQLFGSEHPLVAILLNEQAQVLTEQGHLAEAEVMFRQALDLQRRLKVEDTTTVLNNLSMTLSHLGRQGEAEELLREALATSRRLKGGDHEDVATELGNLGACLEEQGDLGGAESALREALSLSKRLHGTNHPHVASVLNTLANVLQKQNKVKESEDLFRELLILQRKLYKNPHPNVAAALNGLGLALHKQGRDAEAEPLLREGVKIQTEARTAPHPQTARLIGNLGRVLEAQSKLEEAEDCFRKALETYHRLPGPEHADVVSWRHRLAGLLETQKKWPELEALYREILTAQKKRRGNEHPEVATSLRNLAPILQNQGKAADAEDMYRQALEIQRKRLGSEHQEVAETLDKLAGFLRGQRKTEDAETCMREAVGINRKLLENDSPLLARRVGKLGEILEDRGKFAEAEVQYREALAMSAKPREAGKGGVAPWRLRLDGVLEKQGKLPEQELLRRESLEEARKKEPSNPFALEGQILLLAENLHRQSRYGEANSLYREAIDRRKARLGPDNTDVVILNSRLALLLTDWAWSERDTASHRPAEAAARSYEAERLSRECLAACLRRPSVAPADSAELRSRLGSAIVAVAETDGTLSPDKRGALLSEAEGLLLASVRMLQEIDGISMASRRDALTRLVRLYHAWKKPEMANPWKRRLVEIDIGAAANANASRAKSPSKP